MATITKRNDKQWQAKVRKKGFSTVSKTFPTKAAAQRWARDVESEMDKGSYVSLSVAETTTLNSIFERYLDEEVPKKKSIADHNSRIKRLNLEFGHFFLIALTPAMVREFRDERLEYVTGDTVRKDISLLGRILKLATSEWDIHLPRGNPVNSVKLPSKGGSRNRRFVNGEEALLLNSAKNYGGLIESIMSSYILEVLEYFRDIHGIPFSALAFDVDITESVKNAIAFRKMNSLLHSVDSEEAYIEEKYLSEFISSFASNVDANLEEEELASVESS